MSRNIRLTVLLAACVCCLFVFAGTANSKGKPGGDGKPGGGGGDADPDYIVVDLGSADASGGFRAVALNNFGGVIKHKNGFDELWELAPDGTVLNVRNLPSLPDEPDISSANDMNDQFRIAGSAEYLLEGEYPVKAVAWDASGPLVELIELPIPEAQPGFFSISTANGVSENGLICGRYFERISGESGFYNRKAFVWQITDNGINTVELPNGVEADDVNSDGIVIGRQPEAGGAASIWVLHFDESGNLIGSADPIALPGLGGPPIDVFEITDSGLIAGESWTDDLHWHAALWAVDEFGQLLGLQDLGLPGNNDKAGAAATNIVGETIINARAENTKGKSFTITWTPYLSDANGNLTPLNSLNMDFGNLRDLEIGLDINDFGWISGSATTRTDSHAFVAIPVLP